jgi:hypothetical protein
MASVSRRHLIAGALTLVALLLMFALLWGLFSTPFASTLPGMTGEVELDDGSVATWMITHSEATRVGTLVYFSYRLQGGSKTTGGGGGGQDYLPKGVRTTEAVEEWTNDTVKEAASLGDPEERQRLEEH